MRLIDIVNGPWAILADTHREIHDIYKRHLKGDKIDVQDLNIQKRDPLVASALVSAAEERNSESRGSYMVIDNVAVIPVHDVISKRMTWFMEICGGCSSQIFMRDFADAQNDPQIVGIIPYFDTPGGTVDGTAEAADLMAGYRGNKPVLGFTDGMICSAGYWMAAACDEIHISSDTNPIGSIGVVAAHVDMSKRMEMVGQRVTEITAGDHKRIASSYSPLTVEGHAYIQDQLNYIYTGFTDFVSKHRNVDIENHKEWADGRVFLGSQSFDVGLVDGVSTLGTLIDRLAGGRTSVPQSRNRKKPAAAGAVGAQTLKQEVVMTKAELQEKHPDLYREILEEGKAAAVAENAESVKAAIKEEQGRVVALVSAGFGEEPGKKFAAVMEKGLSSDDMTSLGISFAQADTSNDNDSRKEILEELRNGGQQPVGKIAGKQDENFETMVTAYRKDNSCGRGTAVSAVAKAHPDLHKAWLEDQGK
jgi:signal peptide peptidase SppA